MNFGIVLCLASAVMQTINVAIGARDPFSKSVLAITWGCLAFVLCLKFFREG